LEETMSISIGGILFDAAPEVVELVDNCAKEITSLRRLVDEDQARENEMVEKIAGLQRQLSEAQEGLEMQAERTQHALQWKSAESGRADKAEAELLLLQSASTQQTLRLIQEKNAAQATVARLREAGMEVWESVPSTYDPHHESVERHARALNALHEALAQETP
jgi:hypothetical protein